MNASGGKKSAAMAAAEDRYRGRDRGRDQYMTSPFSTAPGNSGSSLGAGYKMRSRLSSAHEPTSQLAVLTALGMGDRLQAVIRATRPVIAQPEVDLTSQTLWDDIRAKEARERARETSIGGTVFLKHSDQEIIKDLSPIQQSNFRGEGVQEVGEGSGPIQPKLGRRSGRRKRKRELRGTGGGRTGTTTRQAVKFGINVQMGM